MQKTAVNAADAPAPIGPYTPAVRTGDLLFTSGQVGFDPASGQLVPGGIEAETMQVMRNLEGLLQAAGLTFSDVVKTTIFLADMADFAVVNAIYSRSFEVGVAPARSTVQVAALPRGARIEVEAIARFPQP